MKRPSKTPRLSEETMQRIARAIAEPTRFEIMRRVFAGQEGIFCGAALDGLSITPGTASHHIAELEEAGLIDGEKRGRYRLLKPCRDAWAAYLEELEKL